MFIVGLEPELFRTFFLLFSLRAPVLQARHDIPVGERGEALDDRDPAPERRAFRWELRGRAPLTRLLSGASVSCPHSSQRDPLKSSVTSQSGASGLRPCPQTPTPRGIKSDVFKGPFTQPTALRFPLVTSPSHVLCSRIRGLCFYTRTVSSLSSGWQAASPQTSDPSSSAQKLSHPQPSLAPHFTFNSWFLFLAVLCSLWGS